MDERQIGDGRDVRGCIFTAKTYQKQNEQYMSPDGDYRMSPEREGTKLVNRDAKQVIPEMIKEIERLDQILNIIKGRDQEYKSELKFKQMDMVFEEDDLMLDRFRIMAADGQISKDFYQNLVDIVFKCDITESMPKDEASNFPEAEWSNFFHHR